MTRGQQADKPRLLVLVGPTAVGKTAFSLEIAKAWNAEIISGDSMQVYKGMDIGTAKLPFDERAGIVHHLIDICDPDEPFSAAEFQTRCRSLIPEITARGKLPFIVGGTGLYVESVCYDFQFSDVGSDDAYRDELQQLAAEQGNEVLHEQLRRVDPETAGRLHPNDNRRVIRALEVFRLTGAPMSEQLRGQKKTSPYDLCIIGMNMERSRLYERVEQRIDLMMEQGLVAEVERLLEAGVSDKAIAMQGLGYKEIVPYLRGECSLEQAVYLLKRDTRHFAKRQLSWFRHMQDLNWAELDRLQNFNDSLQIIHGIIAGKFRD